ncbi:MULTISPECIES: FKBP-type peptidyl-prolyl cis-trans isomerase [unclassified Aliivibrio]|uniref:FKBP-type peptidyl-prolyl cis-trans isomerase n=1 Tax=unclassified Aliivibrio TaxID=2645654 RepID=UPI00080E3C91|nr:MULTISPECIES: FKBP-type peptidyl-prolyl cis-trans isomerase [unclassified Aliivibrio]OCH14832.1 peptidylprolyl isomerase [Aliivibrio sp. 1S165]OCH25842.1 peptidylprolyl isomerase [Aliivibrio sp. 1S128]OCH34768.1 peptidylprolyl isomerase [Aliivibrio sp. 1S175]
MSKIIITIAFIVLGYMLFQHFVNNPKAAKENIELGNAFLAENATKEGVQTTASGLQYLVLEEGTGTEHPTAKSKVKVHYHGTTIDGNVFDSSVERGEPIEFGLGQVIKGWTEGVQLMVVGQKMRFFIPSNLAYGNRSAGSIQPGSVLIFEVELLDFK